MRLYGRPTRATLTIIAFMVAGFSAAFASPVSLIGHAPLHEKKHDAKRQVQALEEEWRQAQLTGDVAAMDRLLSDDFIGISMTGQVNTKAQQLDRVRNHKIQLTRLDLGEMQIKLVGSIAIVTSRADVEGTSDGNPVRGTFRYTRVYQRLPSGEWKITSFEATRVPASRENHNHEKDPVPPGTPGSPSNPTG